MAPIKCRLRDVDEARCDRVRKDQWEANFWDESSVNTYGLGKREVSQGVACLTLRTGHYPLARKLEVRRRDAQTLPLRIPLRRW